MLGRHAAGGLALRRTRVVDFSVKHLRRCVAPRARSWSPCPEFRAFAQGMGLREVLAGGVAQMHPVPQRELPGSWRR